MSKPNTTLIPSDRAARVRFFVRVRGMTVRHVTNDLVDVVADIPDIRVVLPAWHDVDMGEIELVTGHGG